MAEKKTFRDSLLRTVALLGLLLVLLLGAWGIILLAFNLPTIAGSVGTNITSIFTGNTNNTDTTSTDGESLAVNAPASATSGQSFVLSWQSLNATDGRAYTISYACQTGLSVKAPTASGQYQAVSCNTPFNYTNASEQMSLVATVTGNTSAPAVFTVAARTLDNGTITASNSATVLVVRTTPVVTQPAPTQTTPSTTYIPATRPATLYGYADLAVRIISINSLSSYQGRTAVKFEITNLGTNVAQSGWSFDAVLPLTPSYTYTAASQQALYPGDKIVYTMTFDRPVYNYNQYCTLQYPNYNLPTGQAGCNNGYNNGYPYQQYPYQQTCYTYNGYQNIPVPCVDGDGYPVYNNQNYNYNTYPYNGGYGYQGGTVTITADPRGLVYDLNRANNTASIAAPTY
ncbi:MAG TPA: hypothetical protein VHD31_01845 [Candidatus Paceibacterota bacterium]|nr:hypothetical protein [Candidatus Paceibacterota bacterium]